MIETKLVSLLRQTFFKTSFDLLSEVIGNFCTVQKNYKQTLTNQTIFPQKRLVIK